MKFRLIVVNVNRDEKEKPNVVVASNNGHVVFHCRFSANLVPNHVSLLIQSFPKVAGPRLELGSRAYETLPEPLRSNPQGADG